MYVKISKKKKQVHEIKHFIKLETMKILHNEVSGYEPVTGPSGAHFL